MPNESASCNQHHRIPKRVTQAISPLGSGVRPFTPSVFHPPLSYNIQNTVKMGAKFLYIIQQIMDSVTFSFFASTATAILRPQQTVAHTVKVAIATTIIGTLVGVSIEQFAFLQSCKYAIVTLVGLFGKEIYEYLERKMKNPVAFFKEIRTGKDSNDFQNTQNEGSDNSAKISNERKEK